MYNSFSSYSYSSDFKNIIVNANLDFVLNKNEEAEIEFFLKKNQQYIKLEDILSVHENKIHILIIDETLSDYQHVHAEYLDDIRYRFSFVPKTSNNYKIWLNFTLADNNEYYVPLFIEGINNPTKKLNKKVNYSYKTQSLTYELYFEEELAAGSSTMGVITVTKDGEPFERLEPIMGSFGHIVAFPESLKSVIHTHPIGDEPESADDISGPEVRFYITPITPGYMKIFLQVKIDGKEEFIPFNIKVI